jgi:hypothetical protein
MDDAPLELGKVRASAAYHALTGRAGLVSIAHRNKETPFSVPKDYYAHAGRLARLLLEGDEHHLPLGGPQGVDREGFQRIVDWLDVNAEFYGDYSWNKREWAGAVPGGEAALRQHVREVFGPEWAEQPYAALVNVCLPSERRILMAPLSVEAGGWGQVSPSWSSTADPAYRKMHELVVDSIAPLPAQDVCGTCNRDPCECRSCWVREARAAYLQD